MFDITMVLYDSFTLLCRNVDESCFSLCLFLSFLSFLKLKTAMQTTIPQGVEYRICLSLLQVEIHKCYSKEKVWFQFQFYGRICLQHQRRPFLEVSVGICSHNLAINWISLKELLFFPTTSIIKLEIEPHKKGEKINDRLSWSIWQGSNLRLVQQRP